MMAAAFSELTAVNQTMQGYVDAPRDSMPSFASMTSSSSSSAAAFTASSSSVSSTASSSSIAAASSTSTTTTSSIWGNAAAAAGTATSATATAPSQWQAPAAVAPLATAMPSSWWTQSSFHPSAAPATLAPPSITVTQASPTSSAYQNTSQYSAAATVAPLSSATASLASPADRPLGNSLGLVSSLQESLGSRDDGYDLDRSGGSAASSSSPSSPRAARGQSASASASNELDSHSSSSGSHTAGDSNSLQRLRVLERMLDNTHDIQSLKNAVMRFLSEQPAPNHAGGIIATPRAPIDIDRFAALLEDQKFARMGIQHRDWNDDFQRLLEEDGTHIRRARGAQATQAADRASLSRLGREVPQAESAGTRLCVHGHHVRQDHHLRDLHSAVAQDNQTDRHGRIARRSKVLQWRRAVQGTLMPDALSRSRIIDC